MDFPRKPLLDRVIVREIPIAEYYEQPEGLTIDLDNAHIKERSDRGVVVAVSKQVEAEGEIAVGDTVFYDADFVISDPVYLNPAHKNRPDLPKYWQVRVADLKGVAVSDANILNIPPAPKGAVGRSLGIRLEDTILA
jgi:co-chaperonin GroES (HSP10)